MAATDILGKIGEKVGAQIKALEQSVGGAGYASDTELTATQTGAGLGTDGTYTALSTGNYISGATSLYNADTLIDAQVKLNTTAIGTNASQIDTVESSVGLNADGTYLAETNSNYIDDASSIAESITLLDTQVGTNASNIATNATNISNLDTNKYDKSGGTITGAVTISGNLTVTGTTTTVNSTEVSVADNTIEVNLSSDGSATATTGGFNVNRGNDGAGDALDKAGVIWDNTNSTWHLKLGSADANLKAGTVTASLTGAVTGNVTGDLTGNVLAPNSNGIKINNVSLGDYSTFETAFNAAIA